jgi:copper transport protein
MRSPRRRHRPRRIPWLLLVAAVVGLLAPALAAAHASLIRSAPSDGQVVEDSPDEVTLTFTEPVETALGAVRVYDSDARRVDADATTRPARASARAAIPETLANGTYTVSWRVVSTDGHPIEGAFVFHVGAPGPNPEGIAAAVRVGPSRATEIAIDVFRSLDLALVVALIGSVLVLAFLIRSRAPDVERRLWHVVAGLGFTLSIVAGATLALHAATIQGVGVGGATRGSTLTAVLETRFGQVRLAQLVAAEVIAVAAVWAAMTTGPGRVKRALALLAVGLTVTPGLGGHAGARGAFAVVADAAHVLAAAVWVGGLATVLLALRLAGEDRGRLGAEIWPRFSNAALGSVAVLLVAGVVGSFNQVDRVSGLWQTDYGRLLLAKMGLALVLIGFGVANRRRIRGRREGTGRFERVVAVEVAAMAAAVAVTSMLIGQPPARGAVAGPRAAVATTSIGLLTATVSVQPGLSGDNDVVIDLARAGAPATADEVTVTAKPVAGGVGPFRLTADASGPGTYVTPSFPAPRRGPWSFEVAVRQGEFDLDSAAVTIPIGGP